MDHSYFVPGFLSSLWTLEFNYEQWSFFHRGHLYVLTLYDLFAGLLASKGLGRILVLRLSTRGPAL